MIPQTAILPVAGRGTRMMPLTLHQPKGMIALADKPLFHHVIDELVSAGLEKIIIVLGPDQEVFRNYVNYHLNESQHKVGEIVLSLNGAGQSPKKNSWDRVRFRFVYQKEPWGDGDAVLRAKKFIKKGEPFVVAFSDDIFYSGGDHLKKMGAEFGKRKTPILLLEKVPRAMVARGGIIKPGLEKLANVCSVADVVEKPQISQAPSNLMVVGRYVLTHSVFGYIRRLYPRRGKEIRIADALHLYLKDNKPVWGVYLNHLHFDCGSKEGLIKAQACFASNHPQVGKELRKTLI